MDNVETETAPPIADVEADNSVDEAIEEARAARGPYARHVTMTPKRAGDLFENRNTHNRPFSQADAEKYRDAIIARKWATNGEAVKIDRNGVLLDGQHRCWAIWQAGIPVRLLLVTGLDPDVFSTLDQGRKRSGGDVLAIRGVKRHSLVANTCAMLYRIIKDKPAGQGVSLPAYSIETIWERHPSITETVEACVPVYQRGDTDPVITLPYLAAFRYLLDPLMAETEKAASLVEGLIVGAELKEDDPMFRFRQRINDTRKRSASMAGGAKLALLAKTVGMHLTGERVGRAAKTPDATETFSTFIPGMKEALDALSPLERLDDLKY